MKNNYSAEQREILRLNQHLQEKMTDQEILDFAKQLASEEDLDEDNCTPEPLRFLRGNDNY